MLLPKNSSWWLHHVIMCVMRLQKHCGDVRVYRDFGYGIQEKGVSGRLAIKDIL